MLQTLCASSFTCNRSLLTARAERKDTRVFAHATAETQVAITDNYGNRPVTRSANLVFNTQEPGFLEVGSMEPCTCNGVLGCEWGTMGATGAPWQPQLCLSDPHHSRSRTDASPRAKRACKMNTAFTPCHQGPHAACACQHEACSVNCLSNVRGTVSGIPAHAGGAPQVFPRVASRPPRLLQELEAMMVDRLRTADKVSGPAVFGWRCSWVGTLPDGAATRG